MPRVRFDLLSFGRRRAACSAGTFFSNLIYYILGYFYPLFFFNIVKINIFRGDLSDISAKTATLVLSSASFVADTLVTSPQEIFIVIMLKKILGQDIQKNVYI